VRHAAALLASVVAMLTLVPATALAQPPASPSPWTERRVLNVAHAGGDLEAPHSTLFAMRSAVAAGADVLEMDVRLSADGVLMVQHDDTVDRTTEATGPVGARTVSELQALDNAYWFVPDCWSCRDRPSSDYGYRGIRTGERPPPAGFEPADFSIPTLDQVAAVFPDRLLDIEIKDGPSGMAAAAALAAFIAAHGSPDRYLVASFDDAILAYFKTLAPHVATSPGLGTMVSWFATRGPLPEHRVLQVPPTYSGIEVVTQQFVDDAHANDLAVWVWFNGNEDDAPAEWQRLVNLGVDALLTGKPRAAETTITGNGATFSVAPEVGPAVRLKARTANLDVACPALHVATCQSVLVVLTRDRMGSIRLVAWGSTRVTRGSSAPVPLAVDPRAPRGWRDDLFVVAVPLNPDTAPVGRSITVSRR